MRIALKILFLFLISMQCVAQLRVKSGTQLTIDNGTVVTVDIRQKNFVLDSATLVTNNGIIVLGDSTNIHEVAGYPVIGLGTETTTRNLNTGLTGVNVGGLGFYSNTDSIPGMFTIIRGHLPKNVNGSEQGIKRWYKLSSTDTLPHAFSFAFGYDTTELNGNIENDLKAVFAADTSLTWYGLGGNANTSTKQVSTTTTQLGYFTFYASNIKLLGINDTSFCVRDSVTTSFTNAGLFNPDNVFVWELSDASGFFLPPSLSDTLTTDTVDFFSILPDTFVTSNFYRIRIHSTSPVLYSADTTIHIHALPLLSFSTLLDGYCQNLSPQSIGATPNGGTYDVSFLAGDSIYPNLASIGLHEFTYMYTDAFGCSAAITDSVSIYGVPLTPTITQHEDSLLSSVTTGNLQWYLDGNPIAGATNYFIVPTSNGVYEVEVTDSVSCSVISDTFNFTTLGVSLITNNFDFTFYPNPLQANGTLYLNIPANDLKNCWLTNSAGAKINFAHTSQTQNNNVVLNFNGIGNGMYILTIATKNGIVLSKPLVIVN